MEYLAVQDDIFVTTNDSDIRFTSGDGEIHIGNGGSEEPIQKRWYTCKHTKWNTNWNSYES